MADDPATVAERLLSFIDGAQHKASGMGVQRQVTTPPLRLPRTPRPSNLQLVLEDCLAQLTPDECDALGHLIEQLSSAL
jgi:hypothetical protein